jgi:hypothetical protein
MSRHYLLEAVSNLLGVSPQGLKPPSFVCLFGPRGGLRGCDFFGLREKAALKPLNLRTKKRPRRKKVTNSQHDTSWWPPLSPGFRPGKWGNSAGR